MLVKYTVSEFLSAKGSFSSIDVMRNKKNCKKGVLIGNCAVKAPLLSQLTFSDGRTGGCMRGRGRAR